ncbi:MAG: hypothetical protein M1824_001339 [Vezdaea acicularis]|nr:MAG: hypothetical protein M1824_001339 [Vezdaea acicularis]
MNRIQTRFLQRKPVKTSTSRKIETQSIQRVASRLASLNITQLLSLNKIQALLFLTMTAATPYRQTQLQTNRQKILVSTALCTVVPSALELFQAYPHLFNTTDGNQLWILKLKRLLAPLQPFDRQVKALAVGEIAIRACSVTLERSLVPGKALESVHGV